MLRSAILFAHFCKLLRHQITHQALQRITGATGPPGTDVSHPISVELTSPGCKLHARTIEYQLENLYRGNTCTKLAGRNTRRPSSFRQVNPGHIDDVTAL